jgi:hypothetical protein
VPLRRSEVTPQISVLRSFVAIFSDYLHLSLGFQSFSFKGHTQKTRIEINYNSPELFLVANFISGYYFEFGFHGTYPTSQEGSARLSEWKNAED